MDISGATAALVNVVGGPDMTMEEAEGVVQEVYNRVDQNARIIWGAQIDPRDAEQDADPAGGHGRTVATNIWS